MHMLTAQLFKYCTASRYHKISDNMGQKFKKAQNQMELTCRPPGSWAEARPMWDR